MSTVNMPVHAKRFASLPRPLEAFARAYRHVLPESDFRTIEELIKQGHVDVVIDAKTRAIEVHPDSQTEEFVNMVFEALVEEAAQEAGLL